VNELLVGPIFWNETGALWMSWWLDQCPGLEPVPCEWDLVRPLFWNWTGALRMGDQEN